MAGIYIHIPFCKQRCTYCDFHFSTSFQSYYDRMVDAICQEIVMRKSELENEPLNSIYFGGGTPSLLETADLNRILKSIRENYDVNNVIETTLEANPDDINESNLRSWKESGIDRLSIGIQSFRESDLIWMNRSHNVEEAKTCIGLAKKQGFESFSVDLIYGLPGLSMQEWDQHIQNVIDYGVSHISAYCLTVEEKTALSNKVKKGEIILGDEDDQADQFEHLVHKLKASGYEQYEVSNFSKPEKEAIHNTSYWKGTPYLGIGPSAHSFDGSSRRFNVANNALYMKGLNENTKWYEVEFLTDIQRFNEGIMTGLRTKWGVSVRSLTAIFEPSSQFKRQLKQFEEKGWVKISNSTIYLSERGWLMADYIASELFEIEDKKMD